MAAADVGRDIDHECKRKAVAPSAMHRCQTGRVPQQAARGIAWIVRRPICSILGRRAHRLQAGPQLSSSGQHSLAQMQQELAAHLLRARHTHWSSGASLRASKVSVRLHAILSRKRALLVRR